MSAPQTAVEAAVDAVVRAFEAAAPSEELGAIASLFGDLCGALHDRQVDDAEATRKAVADAVAAERGVFAELLPLGRAARVLAVAHRQEVTALGAFQVREMAIEDVVTAIDRIDGLIPRRDYIAEVARRLEGATGYRAAVESFLADERQEDRVRVARELDACDGIGSGAEAARVVLLMGGLR